MNNYDYQKIRGLRRKLELIKLRGGKCEICGYCKNVAAFDFHHINPKEKSFQLDLRHLSNQSMSVIIEEFEKCKLLCSNCHREIHSPNLDLESAKLLVENSDESIIQVKEKKENKCIDCGVEINLESKRCVTCQNINKRKVERPDLEILLNEIKNNSQEWCANKYGVSRTTIRRWLEK
jgi:DNA-binding protein Fis